MSDEPDGPGLIAHCCFWHPVSRKRRSTRTCRRRGKRSIKNGARGSTAVMAAIRVLLQRDANVMGLAVGDIGEREDQVLERSALGDEEDRRHVLSRARQQA